jgi:hypothetical protein
MNKLPAPRPESDKRKALIQRVEETKADLDQSWQVLKRDAIITAASAASAYVGVRVLMWLFSSKKPKQKQTKQPEIRYVEVQAPKKSGNGLLSMVLNRAGALAFDMLLEKVQDNLPTRNKSDK